MRLFLIGGCVLLMVACGQAPVRSPLGSVDPSKQSDQFVKRTGFAIDLSDTRLVREKIMAQYIHWKGVPYQFGGQSKRGVDCSGLVQTTFYSHFGYRIPRTTSQQINMGQAVVKHALTPGDVVFFRIGRATLHNGIYYGDGQFLHASSSRGVTFSTLTNPYWRKHYLTARRVR